MAERQVWEQVVSAQKKVVVWAQEVCAETTCSRARCLPLAHGKPEMLRCRPVCMAERQVNYRCLPLAHGKPEGSGPWASSLEPHSHFAGLGKCGRQNVVGEKCQ